MRAVKPLLCLLLLTSLCASVSALSISVEPAIPAGTQWSISISHSITDGQDLKVFLDNYLLFDAYGRSGKVLVDETQKSSSVVAYSLLANELVLSVSGMNEGTEAISAQVFNGTTQVDSTETSVDFFRAISYSEKNELVNKISSLEQTISQLRQDLNSKQSELDALHKSETEFTNSLKKVSSELSSLQKDSNTKQESIEKITSDLNALITQQEKQQNPLSGLLSFGASNSLALGAVFLAVIVVVGAVLFVRKRKGSVYEE